MTNDTDTSTVEYWFFYQTEQYLVLVTQILSFLSPSWESSRRISCNTGSVHSQWRHAHLSQQLCYRELVNKRSRSWCIDCLPVAASILPHCYLTVSDDTLSMTNRRVFSTPYSVPVKQRGSSSSWRNRSLLCLNVFNVSCSTRSS